MKSVAFISGRVVKTLKLDAPPGTPVYMGASNIAHMRERHPGDFKRYGGKIGDIVSNPDFVRANDDGSILFIKKYSDYVAVAVRPAGDGLYYARSVYSLVNKQVKDRIAHGLILSLTNE